MTEVPLPLRVQRPWARGKQVKPTEGHCATVLPEERLGQDTVSTLSPMPRPESSLMRSLV